MISKKIYFALAILALLSSCGDYEKTERPENTLVEDVAITFSEDGDAYQFNAPNISEWNVYELKNNTIGANVAIDENGLLDKSVEEKRDYFAAISKEDTLFLATRHLNITGAENARDLGGLFTKEGHQVKWGQVYRSGMLSDIEEDDFEMLRTLNIQTICDFRQDAEVAEDPDKWPDYASINTVRIPVGDDNLKPDEVLKQLEAEDFDGDALMIEANKGFAGASQEDYTAFFKLLLDDSNLPILYHCSAGKDRAGFASALILSALDVDRETIIDEYLLTNHLTHGTSEDKIEKAAIFYGIEADKLRQLMGVKKSYINAAFEVIDTKYGGMDNYLCQELGVCENQREQLKSKLLYDYNPSFVTDELGIELPKNKDQISAKSDLEGAPNFRQFNVTGNKIKDGMLYRSGALHELTPADVRKLEKMDIKTVVDFRYKNEIKEDPDKRIATVKNTVNFPIGRNPDELKELIDDKTYAQIRTWYMEGNFAKVDSVVKANNINIAQSRIDRYESFPIKFIDAYGNFIKMLTNESNYPVVFHCQGGKDRAGFAAALVLKTLGYDDEQIIQDYVTTNLYNYDEVSKMYKMGVTSLKPSYGANAEQLRASFAAIDREYGSFDNYLRKGLNLTDSDIANIKKNLLKAE